MATRDLRPLTHRRALAAALALAVSSFGLTGCTASPAPPDLTATPTATPTAGEPSPSATSTTLPAMSGVEFDRALRNGAAQGQTNLPPFGRLLAATETDGPTTITIDPAGFRGAIIGVLACGGDGNGPSVSVRRDDASLLWFRTDGCNPGNLYSGRSQPIGAGGTATLTVSAPSGTRFALVIEEVSDGSSPTPTVRRG